MNSEGLTGQGGWEAARRRAKAKFARKMALSRHWKTRWEKEPEFMRASLDRLNAAKKAKAAEITKVLAQIAGKMPNEVESWTLRQHLSSAIAGIGGTPDRKKVHKVLMAMRRRGMLTYHPERLLWTVAYPCENDSVAS